MGKRLNDTAALSSAPVALGRNDSVTVSRRKIDNGSIVTTSTCKDGDYKYREEFQPDNSGSVGNEGLKTAINHLKGN